MRYMAVVPVLLFLSGCGKKPDTSAVKERVRQLANTTAESIEKYEEGDLSGFRGQFLELKQTLSQQDFPAARACADRIDSILGNETTGRIVGFLQTQAHEGVDRAREEVREYMAETGRGEAELAACRELLVYFEDVDRKELGKVMGALVYVLLESKMNHEAAIPAAIVQVLIEGSPKEDGEGR